jgi:hypothetical protein
MRIDVSRKHPGFEDDYALAEYLLHPCKLKIKSGDG